MMKTPLLVIASLALGTAAIAQDTAPTNAPNAGMPPTGTMPMPSAPDPAMAPPPAGAMAPTDTGAAPPPSDPGMSAPAGGMSPPPASSSMPMAATDTSSYPRCSRTVTDKCVQGGGMTGAKKMRHKH